MTNHVPNDLSHPSEEEFNSLCPQGEHAPGPAMAKFRALCEDLAIELDRLHAWYIEDNDCNLPDLEALLRRARAVLAEQPVGPTPIPVAERLPGPEDLNGILEECWWYEHACWYLDTYQANYTHWLPANALPLPSND